MNHITVFVGSDETVHCFEHKTEACCEELDYAMMGLGLLFPYWCGDDLSVVVLLDGNPIWKQRGKWADLLPDYFPAKNPSGAW